MPPAGKAQGSDTGERSHAAIPLPDRAIETSWLIGLFAVPLVFSPLWLLIIYNDPKYFVLHLIAAVVVVAWTFEWAAGRRDAGPWTLTTPGAGPVDGLSAGSSCPLPSSPSPP
jgi:hypothetical protein